jgi:transposase-like protein
MRSGSAEKGSKKPKRERRSFTDEFKAGAVRLVLDEGKTVAAVARDLDLTQSALGGWVKQARRPRPRQERAHDRGARRAREAAEGE